WPPTTLLPPDSFHLVKGGADPRNRALAAARARLGALAASHRLGAHRTLFPRSGFAAGGALLDRAATAGLPRGLRTTGHRGARAARFHRYAQCRLARFPSLGGVGRRDGARPGRPTGARVAARARRGRLAFAARARTALALPGDRRGG